MKDTIATPADLGIALKAYRKAQRLKAVDIAAHAGRSRDVLNRLEKGQDITTHALFDILRAMGLRLSMETATMPTLEEMQARFADDDAP